MHVIKLMVIYLTLNRSYGYYVFEMLHLFNTIQRASPGFQLSLTMKSVIFTALVCLPLLVIVCDGVHIFGSEFCKSDYVRKCDEEWQDLAVSV